MEGNQKLDYEIQELNSQKYNLENNLVLINDGIKEERKLIAEAQSHKRLVFFIEWFIQISL